jgi:hypothetical protein
MATYNSFKRIATDSIVNSSLAAADLDALSVTAGKFEPSAVTSAKIQDGAVGAAQLAASVDLSGKTVTYREILNSDVAAGAAIAAGKLASGAITTNLGYTPLATANGTMTGVLRVPNGSIASPSITQSGNTNTGISFDGSNNVFFSSAGVQQMSVNSAGILQRGTSDTSGAPAFRSDGTSGWQYNNSYGGTSWRHLNSAFGWSTTQRGGSNFSSDGVFTAPVSGFYHFMFQTYGHNDGNGTENHIHLSFGRNGGVAFARGQTPHGIFAHGTSATYPHGILMDLSTYMDASENMRIYVYWAGNGMRFHGAHSVFNGYLVT